MAQRGEPRHSMTIEPQALAETPRRPEHRAMCGRVTLATSPTDLAAFLGLDTVPELEPRYNIAPTQPIAVVRTKGELELLRWGLVPSWAKDPAIGSRCINARAETVATAPAFRAAFKQRRCLVVVDGFYEWKRDGKSRTPHYFSRADGKPMVLAGLWEAWVSQAGEIVETCTVVTTDAVKEVAKVHDRMPVMVPAEDWDRWLSATSAEASSLLVANGDGLVSVRVGRAVNSPHAQGPSLVAPATDDAPQTLELFGPARSTGSAGST